MIPGSIGEYFLYGLTKSPFLLCKEIYSDKW